MRLFGERVPRGVSGWLTLCCGRRKECDHTKQFVWWAVSAAHREHLASEQLLLVGAISTTL
jgi:hypothetical protein